MGRRSVLPAEWGSYDEEDGEPLDEDLLRAAAEWVAAHRLRYDVGPLAAGLDIALAMGAALGRVCCRVQGAVIAVFALWISASAASHHPAEREFQHAFRLTQSMVHAACCELWDRPGEADWSEWLRLLVGGAGNVVDAACHCGFEPETEAHAVGSEQVGTPHEQLELEARSLLTSCLQVLALFGGPRREHVLHTL